MKIIRIALCCVPLLAYGGSGTPDAHARRESACIGSQDKTCIADLKRECVSMGGKWHGEIVGRGRQWGCERPTKDKGKRCTDSSQCEGSCTAQHPATTRDSPSVATCQCAATTLVPKGVPVFLCTREGIKVIHAD